MSTVVTDEKVLVVNPFMGGNHQGDVKIEFEHCVLRDPRERVNLPTGWVGFEVLTARDGGKLVTWSRMNFEQIAEAKKKFDELVAKGLVPYYLDPKTGQASGRVMDKFDPAEGETMFEQTIFAPTRLATGG